MEEKKLALALCLEKEVLVKEEIRNQSAFGGCFSFGSDSGVTSNGFGNASVVSCNNSGFRRTVLKDNGCNQCNFRRK